MHNLGNFDFVFIVMLVCCFIIRIPFHTRNERLKKVKSQITLAEKLNFMLVFTGSTTLPVLYIFSPWFNFANYSVNTYVGVAGVMFAAFGLWLFWRSHKDLGVQFSPMLEIKEDHKLVVNGVYKRIRHPMYTSIFILSFAQLSLLGNWVVGPAYFFAFLSLYLFRVNHEEKLMLSCYGQEYSEYVKRTGRLIPLLKNT